MEYFAKAAGTARMAWNWAVAEWDEQYRMGGKPNAISLSRYWNSVKYAIRSGMGEAVVKYANFYADSDDGRGYAYVNAPNCRPINRVCLQRQVRPDSRRV